MLAVTCSVRGLQLATSTAFINRQAPHTQLTPLSSSHSSHTHTHTLLSRTPSSGVLFSGTISTTLIILLRI
jgi:hypothetical protein